MLTPNEFPSINPDIVKLDELHDLMSWELNESRLARMDHASPTEIKQYDDDFNAAHEQATNLLKRNRKLYRFAQDCGGLVVEGVIQYGDKYQGHKDYVLGENRSPEAEAEYDAVVVRFAEGNSSFVALYGGLFKRKVSDGSKTATESPTGKLTDESQPADSPAKPEIIIHNPAKNKPARPVTPINIKSTPLNEQPAAQNFELLHAKELKDLPLELSPAGQIILRYAIKNPGFLALNLKQINALKKIYGNDINKLAKDFAGIRDEVIAGLNAIGVAAKWGFDGQNKGKRYYLLRHTENIAAETTPSAPVVEIAPRNKANIVYDQQLIKNAVFAEILLEQIDEQLAKMPGHQMIASELLNFFMDNLKFTYRDAREILGELYFKEVLYKTRDESGKLVVSRTKTDRVKTQIVDVKAEKNMDNTEKNKEDPAFTIEEVGMSFKVFDTVLKSVHRNKGASIKTILGDKKEEIQLTRFILGRLVKRGMLIRVLKNTLYIQFPTQAAQDAYKGDKFSYVKPLFDAYNSRAEKES